MTRNNFVEELCPLDPARCPICGRENNCQLCSPAAYKGHCWCVSVKFSTETLERVPPELRNRACLCPGCAGES